jgi:hypothetical protein
MLKNNRGNGVFCRTVTPCSGTGEFTNMTSMFFSYGTVFTGSM